MQVSQIPLIFFLFFLLEKTFGHKWQRSYRTDAIPVTQPTTLKCSKGQNTNLNIQQSLENVQSHRNTYNIVNEALFGFTFNCNFPFQLTFSKGHLKLQQEQCTINK